jgi:hypothetical protein
MTAPFAIQRPAGISIKNATFDELQVVGMVPMLPKKKASPCKLSGTAGELMATGVALLAAPHTRVPMTLSTAPGVPIVPPPANTKPCTSNSMLPVAKSIRAWPPLADHGCPPPVILPTILPACLMPMMWCQRTFWAAAGEAASEIRKTLAAAATKVFTRIQVRSMVFMLSSRRNMDFPRARRPSARHTDRAQWHSLYAFWFIPGGRIPTKKPEVGSTLGINDRSSAPSARVPATALYRLQTFFDVTPLSPAEESQVSEPGDIPIRENASNPLHLSGREAVSFANLKTFVPDLPFGRDLFLRRHRFSFPCMVYVAPALRGESLVPRCEHVLASSRV